ncbi:helix-turn-helix domain-containing protein [Rhizobium sp. Leaf341]|uniref:helix-turn-helix domain-containing protein n=1 Tax=Rhizobium sp. Leaf341 TaxID=1736344 RepID=UPI0007144554|nr:AraC family transcriptional regulator [Rhizobium sp. Leaf341]KQR76036.1 hypothetical protein ASG03_20620 [Rhizobium sp. Leaf341]
MKLNFKADHRPDVQKIVRWKGISLDYVRVTPSAEYAYSWSGGNHYLATHDIVMTDGEMSVAGGANIQATDIRNKMTFLPAECPVAGWSKTVPRQNTFTVLCFDRTFLTEETERSAMRIGERELIYFENAALQSTMAKLETIMQDEASDGGLYAETLALLAVIELGRTSVADLEERRTGKFSMAQERLLVSFIEENLGTAFSLEDLAKVAGLSRYHFTRTFKHTFGSPPHRYVMAKRMAAAKTLLTRPGLTIAEIAPQVGFGTAGHFVRAFKDTEGMTPRDFRKRC